MLKKIRVSHEINGWWNEKGEIFYPNGPKSPFDEDLLRVLRNNYSTLRTAGIFKTEIHYGFWDFSPKRFDENEISQLF